MGTRTIQASVTSGQDVDKPGGQFVTFGKINSDTGPAVNARVTSATMYISLYKSYANSYLNVIYGGNTGPVVASTNEIAANISTHSSTETLRDCAAQLATGEVNTITLGIIATAGSGNKINIRAGCTIKLVIEHEPAYSACSAPTAVSASKNNVKPGESVTLSWSGAKAGTGMSISQYQIYRATSAAGTYSLLTTINSTATSGSTSVTAPTANGSSYYYKVVTIGSVAGYNSAQSSVYATLTCTFSAPGAPSSVTVNNATPDAGGQVTLSWSGAAAGTNNAIAGYQVHRATAAGGPYTLLQSITSTATSGSLAVTAHATMGSAYYYKVLTVGSLSNGALSASYATVTSKVYTACTAPSTVTLNTALVNPGAAATLSWSGAAAGTNNPIASFDVHRATEAGGAYTKLGNSTTTSFAVTAHAAQGSSYFYKVVAVGTKSGYNSPLSSASASLKSNTAPSAATIQAPISGKATYNPKPRLLVTVGADSDGHQQTVTAPGYSPSTAGACAPGKKLVLQRIGALMEAGSVTDTLTSTDALGLTSTASRSYTYGPCTFTDSSLASGITTIKAAHINELRAAINTVREYYGLAPVTWASTVAAGITSLGGWKAHIQEIREALEGIAAFINGWDTASTTNNVTLPEWIAIPLNKPTVAVVRQLRDVIPLL